MCGSCSTFVRQWEFCLVIGTHVSPVGVFKLSLICERGVYVSTGVLGVFSFVGL
jgi:hypothetical protein